MGTESDGLNPPPMEQASTSSTSSSPLKGLDGEVALPGEECPKKRRRESDERSDSPHIMKRHLIWEDNVFPPSLPPGAPVEETVSIAHKGDQTEVATKDLEYQSLDTIKNNVNLEPLEHPFSTLVDVTKAPWLAQHPPPMVPPPFQLPPTSLASFVQPYNLPPPAMAHTGHPTYHPWPYVQRMNPAQTGLHQIHGPAMGDVEQRAVFNHSTPPFLLFLPNDERSLSPYQCLVRKQIQVFEASSMELDSNAQGRNKPISFGQVGVRCRHCITLPPKERGRGSTYYPTTLEGAYQACQNLASFHLAQHCQHIPIEIRNELAVLKDRKSSAGGGKKYWADGLKVLDVYEDLADNRLRFSTN